MPVIKSFTVGSGRHKDKMLTKAKKDLRQATNFIGQTNKKIQINLEPAAH